jgi:NAD(P)-dependent dehydrogenase (short-subunit alcohol dehydrogenase family)
MELRGRRALVTGASRGIGRALSDALEAEGCEVVRVSRSGPERCDVSDERQVLRLASSTRPVDLLVNNAGVIHEPAPVREIPLSEWERLFRTNLFGMVAMIRAFLPGMERRGSGAIVNLSSGWGRFAEANQAPYCATKFAVEALGRALAAEVGPGILVLTVNPGVVATDMLGVCFEGDTGGAILPEECAHRLLRVLRAADATWNGRSVDA